MRTPYIAAALLFPFGAIIGQRVGDCGQCHDYSAHFDSKESATLALVRGQAPKTIARDGRQLTVIDPVFLPLSAEQRAVKPDVFVVMPRTQSTYNRVFGLSRGRTMTLSDVSEVEDARFSLAMTSRQRLRFAREGDDGAALRSVVQQSQRDLIIVGHNENGLLRLPKGEIRLKELDELCASIGRRCFFVSCNSERWVSLNPGVNRSITLSEASEITFQLDRLLQSSRINGWSKVRLGEQMDALVEGVTVSTGRRIVVDNTGKALILLTVAGAYLLSDG